MWAALAVFVTALLQWYGIHVPTFVYAIEGSAGLVGVRKAVDDLTK